MKIITITTTTTIIIIELKKIIQNIFVLLMLK